MAQGKILVSFLHFWIITQSLWITYLRLSKLLSSKFGFYDLQVQFWTSELERRERHQEKQPKHVKQGSLSSSSSSSTVSSITSKYDVNQLKREISQSKARVCSFLTNESCSVLFLSGAMAVAKVPPVFKEMWCVGREFFRVKWFSLCLDTVLWFWPVE